MPPARRTDAEAEAILGRYRKQYHEAPLGSWCSCLDYSLGVGFDGTGLSGSRIEFRPDGTGSYESGGLFGGEPRTEFHWSNSGANQVAIVVDGEVLEAGEEPERVAYHFFMLEGCSLVFLTEGGGGVGEEWFWRVTGPLVRVGDEQNT
jgi:hypothetical protein